MAKTPHNKKSSAEHKALGTYRADRHAKLTPKLKGKPLPKTAKPPVYFKFEKAEQAIWKKVVDLLVAHKLATELDTDAIAQYTRSLYQWITYSDDVQRNGTYIESARGVKSNPAANFMHQAWVRCQMFQKQFGLNALAREALEDTGWDVSGHEGTGPRLYTPTVQARKRV
jgi:P27 family predicted phage terminase small subunit